MRIFSDSLSQQKLLVRENHQLKHILRVLGKNNKSGESASNTYHSAPAQSLKTVDGGIGGHMIQYFVQDFVFG